MITRRATLVTAAAFATAGTSFAPAAAATPGDLAGVKAAALGATLRPHASARTVGRVYLAHHAAEGDPITLLAAIEAAGEIGGCLAASPLDSAALARAVAEAVRDDYLCRRTIRLDGWVLARTEARLCALTALA